MKAGCLKDKKDERDYVFMPVGAANPINYPADFQLIKSAVKNQGNVNSCVAHSIATIKEIQEYYETGKMLNFSVGWIYGYRVGNQYRGECMYPREALNNLVKYGDVLYNDFPENLEYAALQNLINKRKTNCLAKAKNYRCKVYAKVTKQQDVKNCLYVKHSPVLIVCDLYDDFYKTDKTGIVSNGKKGYSIAHAMTIVGWKRIGNIEYWIVQNSWGTEWGNNGYCYIKIGSGIITDLYTVTDENNIKK